MGRHSLGETKAQSEIDRLRQKTIEKFFDLTGPVFEHIEKSLKAELPCSHCSRDPVTGEHKPGKAVDEQGKCNFCHGTYKVMDVDQRNWAVEQVGSRIAPQPKAMEMTVEDKGSQDEVEKKVKNLSDQQITDLLIALNGNTTNPTNS